jgi:tetratricopeptide (TPR) repeat protein
LLAKRKILLISLALFFTALSLRLFYLYESSDNPSFTAPTIDSATYDNMARTLAQKGRINDEFFWQPFFYPVFLSAIYYLTDSSIIWAKIIQAVLGAVTCTMVFLLGRKFLSNAFAFLAALMTAFYAPLFFFETELLASGWASFWAVALLFLFIKAAEKNSLWLFVMLGLSGGLSVITRPTFLPFFIFGCLWLVVVIFRKHTKYTKCILSLTILAMGFSLVTIPVSLLNKKTTGHFGFMPASGGINFYIGNNPDIDKTLTARPGWGWEELTTLPQQNGVKTDLWAEQDWFYNKVIDFIKERPLLYLKGLAYKSVQLLSSREIPRNVEIYLFGRWSLLLRLLCFKIDGFGFPFGVLLPLTVIGLMTYWHKTPTPVKLFLFFESISIVLVFVTARYRVTLIPVMTLPAALGVAVIGHLLFGRKLVKLAIIGVFIIGICTLSSAPGPFPEELPNYNAELYANVGASMVKHEEYNQAAGYLRKAISLNPNDGLAQANLATALWKTGNIEQALEHCRIALQDKPDSPEILNNMGAIIAGTGQYEQAIEYYKKALQINPYRPNTYSNLGNVLCLLGKFPQAIQSYHRAIELDPKQARYYYNLAQAYFELPDMDKATEYYAKTLEIDPAFTEAKYDLAWMYNYYADQLLRENKLDEALNYVQKATELYPEDVNNHITLANILATQGKIDQAIQVLQKGIEYMDRTGNKQAAEQLQEKLSILRAKQKQ